MFVLLIDIKSDAASSGLTFTRLVLPSRIHFLYPSDNSNRPVKTPSNFRSLKLHFHIYVAYYNTMPNVFGRKT